LACFLNLLHSKYSMIRKHENSDSWKAGALAIGVHVALLAAMLISFNWKAAHPVATVTEVSLWDKLPAPKAVDVPKPEPQPVVEEKPEIKPEPKPILEDKPKPEEPKVDIELEKKKREQDQKEAQAKIKKEHDELLQKEKELAEKQKEQDNLRKKDALDKLKQEARDEQLADKKAAEKSKKDALKKLQQDALSDENAAGEKQASAASSAANASLIKGFTDKMANKIRSKITSGVCGDGNPVLKVNIDILPTGQIRGGTRITKSSGNATCDEAVEHAILASEPFQLPEDAKLKAEFRDMILTFKPND
jgi:colicin import membrane protein